jgi:hypothetical protein
MDGREGVDGWLIVVILAAAALAYPLTHLGFRLGLETRRTLDS